MHSAVYCMLYAVCSMLHAVCCMKCAACCVLYAVRRCMMYAVCCMMYAVFCRLCGVCCVTYAVRCMLYAVCGMLCAVRCMLKKKKLLLKQKTKLNLDFKKTKKKTNVKKKAAIFSRFCVQNQFLALSLCWMMYDLCCMI